MWIGTLLFALGSGGELFFHSLSWLCKISHPMPCLLENKLTMHSGFGSHFCFCSCLLESVLQVQMAEKMPVNYPLLSRSSPTPFPWGKNAEVISDGKYNPRFDFSGLCFLRMRIYFYRICRGSRSGSSLWECCQRCWHQHLNPEKKMVMSMPWYLANFTKFVQGLQLWSNLYDPKYTTTIHCSQELEGFIATSKQLLLQMRRYSDITVATSGLSVVAVKHIVAINMPVARIFFKKRNSCTLPPYNKSE
jgi:hypothetical protein